MQSNEGIVLSVFWKVLFISLLIGFLAQLFGIPNHSSNHAFDGVLASVPEWISWSFKSAAVLAGTATILLIMSDVIAAKVVEAVSKRVEAQLAEKLAKLTVEMSEQLEAQLTEHFELIELDKEVKRIDNEVY
jgi:uncharacterized protein involved in cysteine biosynthesis